MLFNLKTLNMEASLQSIIVNLLHGKIKTIFGKNAIIMNEQAIQAFDNLLLNYRFMASNNQIILYWQPYTDTDIMNEGITIENKLEIIFQQNKMEVDSHCYISPQHNFLDVIKWYKQRITITYSCLKCDTGRDIQFNEDEKIPKLIKAFCPICESDLILKDKKSTRTAK